MKNKLIVLSSICALSLIMIACGQISNSVPAQTSENVPVQTPNKSPEDEQLSETEDLDTSDDIVIDSPYIGNWYERISGRGRMEVTYCDNCFYFDVIWAESSTKCFNWSFNGKENEAGIICYSEGIKRVVKFDDNGKETITVLSEEEKGSVEVLYDDTLVWYENNETIIPHEFVRG